MILPCVSGYSTTSSSAIMFPVVSILRSLVCGSTNNIFTFVGMLFLLAVGAGAFGLGFSLGHANKPKIATPKIM
jgi:hypothetical protein